MSDPLRRSLAGRDWILADAAMATGAYAMGLGLGDSPELWALNDPAAGEALHRAHLGAGARILLTQSFGANFWRLRPYGAESRLVEINRAAALRARRAAEGRSGILVAGCLGPTTAPPYEAGGPSDEALALAFMAQGRALLEGGADLLWAETLGGARELTAVASAAARLGAPFCVCMSFESLDGRTREGFSPEGFALAARHLAAAPAALGVNCGPCPDATLMIVERLVAAAPEALLIAKPAAGLPHQKEPGGPLVYEWTPQAAGVWALAARTKGVRILGGCCGTGAAHLAAMEAALSDL